MPDRQQTTITRYSEPTRTELPPKRLITVEGAREEAAFVFYDRLDLGRLKNGPINPGHLQVDDPTVSSRHCVITQESDGRCFVRDVSRNGTRLNGRRLSPNLKTEVRVGETVAVGLNLVLRLEGDTPVVSVDDVDEIEAPAGTLAVSSTTNVTVLVGDIRNYTVLAQRSDSSNVQESVSRVFARMERRIEDLGGTLKEFQGDALFAFWEERPDGGHAIQACRAAIEMDLYAKQLASDPGIWQVEDFPLELDWALATGTVAISSHGIGNALGLSMVGEPVVLAFRIEKFADDKTGTIVACPVTRELATSEFQFRDLGTRQPKGFDEPQRIFALVGSRKPSHAG